MLQVLSDLLFCSQVICAAWVTFSLKNTLRRNAFRLVMRAAEAVTSGHIIWDHIVVTGLFLSVTAHVSFHYPPRWWSWIHQTFWINHMVKTQAASPCAWFQWPLNIQMKLRFRTVGSWSFIQLSFAGGSVNLKLLNNKDFRWKTQQISFLWLLIIPSFHVDILIVMINFLCYVPILQRGSPVVSRDTWLLV